ETLITTERLSFGGREWTLTFTALPALRGGSLMPALATLLIGSAISFVIFVLSVRESEARRRAEEALAGLQHSLDEQRRYEGRLRQRRDGADRIRAARRIRRSPRAQPARGAHRLAHRPPPRRPGVRAQRSGTLHAAS